MKRQLSIIFNHQNYYTSSLYHIHYPRWYSTTRTNLWSSHRTSSPPSPPPRDLPPLDIEGKIQEEERIENERDHIPTTSIEDIPHWTKRTLAKQQYRNKNLQVDNETYWKTKFENKDERYYRDYFDLGFVQRGGYAVDVPIQYPKEPIFLPRQWNPSSPTTIRRTQKQLLYLPMSNHIASGSVDDYNHESTTEQDIYKVDTSPLPTDNNNIASKVDEDEEVESTPTTDNQLRIVDVDCNLWHKDLLLLLLPKPPSAASEAAAAAAVSTSDESDRIVESSTIATMELPDCLKILQNDNISPVVAMITPSSTLAEAAKGLDILKGIGDRVPNNIQLRTTVGVHPYHTPDPFHNYHDVATNDSNDSNDDDDVAVTDVASTIEAAKRILDDTMNQQYICAIGECGLDTTTGFPPIAYQIPYLIAQIQLANEYTLPLFIHERNAHDTLIEILDEYVDIKRIPNIIIHCFTGNVLHCETYIKRGYYISLSGFVFREKEASQVQLCLEHDMIPLNRLMIETDAPYMGFTGCRELYIAKNNKIIKNASSYLTSKQRKVYSIKQNYPNPPSSIIMILHQILYHINIGRSNRNETLLTVQELADITTQNANTFFGLGL